MIPLDRESAWSPTGCRPQPQGQGKESRTGDPVSSPSASALRTGCGALAGSEIGWGKRYRTYAGCNRARVGGPQAVARMRSAGLPRWKATTETSLRRPTDLLVAMATRWILGPQELAHLSRRFVERFKAPRFSALLLDTDRRRRLVKRRLWSRVGRLGILFWIAHSPSLGLRSTAKFSSTGGVVCSSGSGAASAGSGVSLGSLTSSPHLRRPSGSPPQGAWFAQAGDRLGGSYRLGVALIVDWCRGLVQRHSLRRGIRLHRLDGWIWRLSHQKVTTATRIASATPTVTRPTKKKRPASLTAWAALSPCLVVESIEISSPLIVRT
jgi:hypothetical protein